jgi:hypothetical protein
MTWLELNYFLLFLNDHVSNFRLPRKQLLTALTPRVKLKTFLKQRDPIE